MGNTVETDMDGTWVQVATAGTSGFVTNETGDSMHYCECNVPPAEALIGHTLHPGDYISFSLVAGQMFYCKADDGMVSITPT